MLPFLSRIEGARSADSTAAGIKLNQSTTRSGSSLFPSIESGSTLGKKVTITIPATIIINLTVSTDIHP